MEAPWDPKPEKKDTGPKQNQGDAEFFHIRGFVHYEYAPEEQTVTKEYYKKIPRRLHDAIPRIKPDFWSVKNWQLHHINAPAHSSHVIQTFLAQHGIPV